MLSNDHNDQDYYDDESNLNEWKGCFAQIVDDRVDFLVCFGSSRLVSASKRDLKRARERIYLNNFVERSLWLPDSSLFANALLLLPA